MSVINTNSRYDMFSGGMGAAEQHIVIGRDRIIVVPEPLRRLAVQYDHNIETVIFDCPRFWDGKDFSTMSIFINYTRQDGYEDSYAVTNVVAEDEFLHFEWTISRNVTEYAGPISFLVCIKDTDDEGNEIYHWNTEINKQASVSMGMEVHGHILDEKPDLVTYIQKIIDSYESGGFGGSIDSEELKRIVEEYFAENPPDSSVVGKDGYSPTIDVVPISGGYELTITDVNGTRSVNVMNGSDGPEGARGEKGDPGDTPNLTIGTVTTLSAGSQATATITGTAEDPVLNLGIPRGADGGSVDGSSVGWGQVTGKPDVFPPKEHSHAYADITGKPGTFPPEEHSHAYADITDKPTAFPPATHTHEQSEVNGLTDALADKAPATHEHAYADITDKPAAFPPEEHSHAYADITGKPDAFPPEAHSHSYADITDKPSAFPPETHSHAYSEITGTPVFSYDPETQTLTITTT